MFLAFGYLDPEPPVDDREWWEDTDESVEPESIEPEEGITEDDLW